MSIDAEGGGVLLGGHHVLADLGTALGDWMADTGGLGYEGGAIVFAAGLAVIAGLYFWTRVSRVLLFWAAFILTRPLGATVGDFPDKPIDQGGMALSRPLASSIRPLRVSASPRLRLVRWRVRAALRAAVQAAYSSRVLVSGNGTGGTGTPRNAPSGSPLAPWPTGT